MAEKVPKSLGRYEILEVLGRGAMGVVYLARDPLIGRLVALKTFRSGYSEKDPEMREFQARFLREAQSAGILNHPCIVTIHDVVEASEEEGATFIAMEYVQGIDLKEHLNTGGRMDLGRASQIVRQVAGALDYAHAKGVIHRDIKPANIILTKDGSVKITDFGIARLDTSDLTQEGQLLGTPNYMAPERILGKETDHRTDIFSLGVVLYEMLSCRKPFRGENLTMVTHRIVYEPFEPLDDLDDVPPGVVAVLDRAMQKSSADRYDTAGEMATDLDECLGDGLVSALEDEGSAETQDVSGRLSPEVRAEALRVATDRASVSRPVAQSPSPSTSRPSLRLAAIVAAALLMGGGLLVGSRILSRVIQPALERPTEAELQRARYRPMLQAARSSLDAGDPQGAARHVARALEVAPQDPLLLGLEEKVRTALSARLEAELDHQIESQMEGARSAFDEGRLEDALGALQEVLSVKPELDEARQLVAATETALERRRVASRRGAPRPAAPSTAPAPVPSPEMAQAPEPARFDLKIEFLTEVSEGTLTLYANDTQILREPFRFVEKIGFLRTRGTAGRIDVSRQVDRGNITFRIYVAQERKPTAIVTLQDEFRGGVGQTLRIVLTGDGELSAQLMPSEAS